MASDGRPQRTKKPREFFDGKTATEVDLRDACRGKKVAKTDAWFYPALRCLQHPAAPLAMEHRSSWCSGWTVARRRGSLSSACRSRDCGCARCTWRASWRCTSHCQSVSGALCLVTGLFGAPCLCPLVVLPCCCALFSSRAEAPLLYFVEQQMKDALHLLNGSLSTGLYHKPGKPKQCSSEVSAFVFPEVRLRTP